jgi:hypothetical protein
VPGGSTAPSAAPSTAPSTAPSAAANACAANAVTASIGAAGGPISNSTSGTITETFAAAAFSSATTVSLGYLASASLPAPLARVASPGRVSPLFTAGAGNTYVTAFCTSFGGATLNGAASLSGGTNVVPSSIAAGTQLNIAINQNNTWVDVGSALVGANGTFTSTAPTVAAPGITQAGTYLVYLPAAGTNTTQINLGFAIIADDSSGFLANGLQYVQLENSSGVALPTPTTTFYPIAASDLDGESLTPDASRGAVVDGGNAVYFFSGIPQGNFILSPTTVDITAYGGDGDSIASLPGGDQAVASGNGTQLAVLSGILAGHPVVADTINNGLVGGTQTDDRDGLVSSVDGKVLLSRGGSGIDVFNVTPVAAHAGSTGTGTTSFSFTLKQTLATGTAGAVASPFFEDGRDGMAISPTDSSRAVVVGSNSTGSPVIQLLTGLTSGTVTVQSLEARLPAGSGHALSLVQRHPETSHRLPQALTPTAGSTLYAVTITPDGTTAYVSTDAGIITVSGVNTGNLAQVGTVYAPVITIPGGTLTLEGSPSIGVLPDGKYLVAVAPEDSLTALSSPTDSNQGTSVVVTIPIGAGDVLGATPAGQLNYVVSPFNDQIVFH